MSTRATLGCFGVLAVIVLVGSGAAAIPVIIGLFALKFVLPAVIFALLVVGFLAMTLGGDDDDAEPGGHG